ncbi:MAG: nicotinamide riboside transporter PnuC [Opitutaceae bacterium]
MTVPPLEFAANVFNAGSIVLAGRNNIHTWWTGVVGCVLFAWVFFHARLYADVTLQAFYILTSVIGWWNWSAARRGMPLPVRHVQRVTAVWLGLAAISVSLSYGWILHRYTNAAAPFVDSLVLAFSVLGQFLLMGRRYENWWCWLLVNTIAVPLYLSRGLHLTAALYVLFWINAVVSLRRWRRELMTA